MATTETNQTTGAQTTTRGGPSTVSLFLGGFAAAAIGYLAAYYGEFGLLGGQDTSAQDELVQITASQEARLDEIEALLGAPDDLTEQMQASEAGLTELQENFGSLAGNIQELDERIGGVEAGISGLSESGGDVGNPSTFDPALIEQLTENSESLQSTLQARIDELSQRIDGLDGGDQIAALEQQLSDISARIEEQQAAIADAQSAAEDETRRIAAQAAISDIRAAVENGESYADAVGAYGEASDDALPEPLTAPADTGIATLASLQDSFPAAARAALDASLQVTAGDGTLDRFGAFLKSQTGARALGEREGTGPDAILSRAEARLNEGQLDAALSELEALPQEGRDAMSDWLGRAQERAAAKAALSDITESTNTN